MVIRIFSCCEEKPLLLSTLTQHFALQHHAIKWKHCNTTPSSARTSLGRSYGNSNWVPRTCPWMHSVVWPVQLQLKCSATKMTIQRPNRCEFATESNVIHRHFPNERQGQGTVYQQIYTNLIFIYTYIYIYVMMYMKNTLSLYNYVCTYIYK